MTNTSPVKLKKKTTTKKKPQPKLTNHICFIVDRSGSMSYLRDDVVENFNKQAAEIRANAKSSGQETFVSFYTFSSYVDDPVFFAEGIEELGDLDRTSYRPGGLTALRDAVGIAISDLKKVDGAKDKSTSFLIVVMTDGAENNSRNYSNDKLKRLIREVQDTDRWSVVFMGPSGASRYLTPMGIHAGNIREWDGSLEEYTATQTAATVGLHSFYKSRSLGASSVKNFFAPDMKNVNREKLRKNFKNQKSKFHAWDVNKTDPLTIRDFVEKKNRGKFDTGGSFYELTKKETVQAYKEFCIMENSTGNIYAGGDARALLKLPTGGNIQLNPSFDKRYKVFVQSTSVNRKLVVGTQLLYKK